MPAKTTTDKRQKSNIDDLLTDDVDINKTSFEKMEIQIKKIIFNVLYVLLKDSETVVWKAVALSLSDFFQIFQFTFLPVINFPWRAGDASVYWNTFLDQFQVAVWLGRLDLTTYIIVIYVMIGIVILILLDIFYVSYSFSRKKFAFVWPLQLLRSSVGLFVTILFLPFLESFTSMLYCVESEDGDGTMRLALFPDLVCWTGQHVIHVAFSIVLKIILNYTYTFFGTEDYQWLLLASCLILSYIAFNQFYNQYAYFNDKTRKFYSCLTGIWLWGNLNLLVAKILESSAYSGGYQLFFLGLPLICGLICFKPDQRRVLLLKNINNFEQGEDVAIQIRYFVKLIQTKDTDRENCVILKGYIYHHEDFCPNPQCQLKDYKNQVSAMIAKKRKAKKGSYEQMGQASGSNAIDQILLNHAKSMYRQAIQKFPNSAELRIQYAFFLKELMNQRQEAIQELSFAANCNPSAVEQFLIFRQMKLAEDEGDSSGDQGSNMDVVSKFAYESTLRSLEQEIKKSAQLHFDFWLLLKSEQPDISKLSDVGLKINRSIVVIEGYWSYLLKLNSNSAKAYIIFSKFLIDVLNDRDRGIEYLQRAKESGQGKGNYFDGANGNDESLNDYESYTHNGTPCIWITPQDLDKNKSHIMKNVNINASRLFGFVITEMKNSSLEKIMPEMYARHHSRLVETALIRIENHSNQSETVSSLINGKEKIVFAKHKSGFIFPVYLQLKVIYTPGSPVQFMGIFKTDKKMISSNITYILVNKEKRIQALSSSAIKMLDLEFTKCNRLTQSNFPITKLCPEVFNELNDMNGDLVKPLDWLIPDFNSQKKKKESSQFANFVNRKSSLSKNDLPTKQLTFNSSLQTITMGEQGQIGWFVKLQKINEDDKQGSLNYQNDKVKMKNADQQKQLRQPLFQFRYDERSGKYNRELRDTLKIDYYQEMIKRLKLNDEPQSADQIEEESKSDEELNQNDIKIELDQTKMSAGESMKQLDLFGRRRQWGKGITIYKLVKGKFYPKDYDEEQKKLEEIEKERQKKKEEEEKAQFILQNGNLDLQNTTKTRKALQAAFNDKSTPRQITNLKVSMNLVVLVLIAISITEFIINNNLFKDIYENFTLISLSYSRMAEIQRIAYNVRTIININEGKQQSYANYTTESDFIDFLKRDTEDAMNILYFQHNKISLIPLDMSQEQDDIVNKKTVAMYFRDRNKVVKTLKFSLREAVLQYNSAVFTVRHMNTSLYTDDQEDIFFVSYNSFDEFLEALQKSSNLYVKDLYSRSNEKFVVIVVQFVVQACVVLISCSLLLPVINNVNKARIDVLSLFIDIPNDNIDILSRKCEDFLLQLDEEVQDFQEDIESFPDDNNMNKNNEEGDQQKNNKKRRNMTKVPINITRSNFALQMYFFTATASLIAYFAGIFATNFFNLNYFGIIAKELHVLTQSEAYYALAQNIQREMIYDAEKPILGEDSLTVATHSIMQLHIMNQYLLKYHFQDRTENTYFLTFNELYEEDLCSGPHKSVIQHDLIPGTCEDILQRAPHYGMEIVLVQYYEKLKESLKFYAEATEDKTIKSQLEFQQKLFNSNLFRDLYIMQFRFISDVFRHLERLFLAQAQSDYDDIISTRLGAFVGYILGIIIAYLVLWIPFVGNLNKQIWRTKSMLTIIPIDVIVKMPKIQVFLNSQSFFSNKKNKK